MIEQRRKATNLRVVIAYMQEAIVNREPYKNKQKIEDNIRYENRCGGETYTPFIPFSRLDNLSINDIRKWFGFLDTSTIQLIARFIQNEASTHAIAEDFRSEYVRNQLNADRKVQLLDTFFNCQCASRQVALEAVKKLEPISSCPMLFWYLPVGNRIRYWCGLLYKVACTAVRRWGACLVRS